jgi:3-mercaptopyruvate sulfurtransferase SseA
MLDGGIGRWIAERRPVTRDAAAEPEAASMLVVARRPEVMATVEDVLAALGNDDVAIVDARSRAEYAGTLVRAARGGAIPGAVHLEYTANLTPDGRYRTPAELRSMYEAIAPGSRGDHVLPGVSRRPKLDRAPDRRLPSCPSCRRVVNNGETGRTS